ncbi:hypothetical protein AAFF_G00332020 [Aldrovandia affinis]|uniref:Uncharacterized protein n=1 Tax=Aldrovandia affinis TaxID=143900 RepID=A0AAD7SLU7_9TELE|nr:hypothetical protein AAFF_G00332020 [Aldrovandia affinis]
MSLVFESGGKGSSPNGAGGMRQMHSPLLPQNGGRGKAAASVFRRPLPARQTLGLARPFEAGGHSVFHGRVNRLRSRDVTFMTRVASSEVAINYSVVVLFVEVN